MDFFYFESFSIQLSINSSVIDFINDQTLLLDVKLSKPIFLTMSNYLTGNRPTIVYALISK